MFCSVYYQSQMHKCFCLTVWLEKIIPWRLLLTTTSDTLVCCTSIIYLIENIFRFTVWQFISGKPVWRSGLETWFFKQKCFFCYQSNFNKFYISCQRTDLVRQKSFSFLINILKANKNFQFFRCNLHMQKWVKNETLAFKKNCQKH